jgi:thiamine monophosphate synthase
MRILFASSANDDILIDTSKSTTTTTTRRYPYVQRHQLHLHRRIRHLASTKIQIKALLLLFLIVITIQSRHCHSFKYVSLISLLSSSSLRKRNNKASITDGYRSSVSIPNRIDTALSSSLSQEQQQHDDDDVENNGDNNEDDEQPNFSFPNHRPVLAIITEQDACQTDEKMERTFNAIRQAVSTNQVDLVSVRLSLPSAPVVAVVENEERKMNDDEDELLLFDQRACTLTKKLVQLSEQKQKQQQQQYYQNIEDQEKQDNNTTSNSSSSSSTVSSTTSPSFRVVCSSNVVSVAVRGRAHGVHVKEHHLDQIPSIIDQFDYPIIIGTSAHSIKSALESYSVNKEKTTMGAIRPHYYFVGTCYTTASHPEKTNPNQLEGPKLPGRIKHALSSSSSLLQLPRILAIGGIDETNCHEPVAFGADGVAVIRAVLQADNPANIVEQMQSNMRMTMMMMMNDNHKR